MHKNVSFFKPTIDGRVSVYQTSWTFFTQAMNSYQISTPSCNYSCGRRGRRTTHLCNYPSYQRPQRTIPGFKPPAAAAFRNNRGNLLLLHLGQVKEG